MTQACDLDAVTARRLMSIKQLSPVELLDSCMRRIEQVDGAVNAMVARSFERADDEARDAQAAIMSGESLGRSHIRHPAVIRIKLIQGLQHADLGQQRFTA